MNELNGRTVTIIPHPIEILRVGDSLFMTAAQFHQAKAEVLKWTP